MYKARPFYRVFVHYCLWVGMIFFNDVLMPPGRPCAHCFFVMTYYLPPSGNTFFEVNNMKKNKKQNKKTPDMPLKPGEKLAIEFGAPVPTDVLGSYTGNAVDRLNLPQQDADDL